RITYTLTPYQGRVGFDFLGFSLRQEARGKAHQPRSVPYAHPSELKTIITPSQEAIQRHRATIDHRLSGLQRASQAHVIAELNPRIVGWATYYNGIIADELMSGYDDQMTQRLLKWASTRHPGKTQDWLFAQYWHLDERNRRIFATPDGKQLRRYSHARLLDGPPFEGSLERQWKHRK
nr:group II intron reverse transcriptase/maturase [Ktedonobacteraceae bacterium]